MNKKITILFVVAMAVIGKFSFAQIVYTDINPDFSVTIDPEVQTAKNLLKIDFNGDDNDEFNFRYDDMTNTTIGGWFLHMSFDTNNEFILKGDKTNSYGGRYLQALDKGASIESGANWGSSVPEPFIGDDSDPNFQGKGDKYVGVKFYLEDKLHYGWVLLSFEGKVLTIKEYAYEQAPSQPIKTGDKGVSKEGMVSSITVSGEEGKTSIDATAGTLQMEVEVLPADATDKSVTWSVNNKMGEASIDDNGLLSAISNGPVTVRATANDGSGIFGELDVNITGQPVKVSTINVQGQNGVTTIDIPSGTLRMEAEVLPNVATCNFITWSVINGTGEASISDKGLLTAVRNGDVTVRASSNDGSGVYGEEVITISNQVVPVESITVTGEGDKTEITEFAGTLQMVATVLPVDSDDKSVLWSITEGEDLATIDEEGLLKALKDGDVTIRATANDDSEAYGEVVITISNQIVLVESITVTGEKDKTSIDVFAGTLQMEVEVLPANAANKSVSWSITKGEDLATIDEEGLLKALKDGDVTIRATANDDSEAYGELVIIISNQTEGIEKLQNVGLSVYPNPFTDQIKISNTKGATINSYKVLDANGKVCVEKITASNENEIIIPTSQLKSGVYAVIILTDNNKQYTYKIVRE
ncbi:MAG: Ig-like domain-containing protein [Hyphomicrobiales bacterium]